MKPSVPPTDRRRWLARLAAWAAMPALAVPRWARAQGLDHDHAAWTSLLRKHVVLLDGGRASQLRYAGMAADRAQLNSYLAALSALSAPEFAGLGKPQQMAFLINAYNAYTVELILTRYPRLESIRDLGSLFRSPWKPQFIPLLGQKMSLDEIEHENLRARGRYDDPRIHFAVNCASIGCPMLREEAYVGERLETQLEEQSRRFMGDRKRNRYNAATGKLELSKIFDWYGDDFKLGHKGVTSLAAFAARHAEWLADAPAERERIRARTVEIAFLDYDWKLNDAR